MKKAFSILCAAFLSLLLGACSLTWDFGDPEGQFDFAYSRLERAAAVISWTFDGDSSKMSILIPDTYGGYPVTRLGSYVGRGVPCPFQICLPYANISYTADASCLAEDPGWWDSYTLVDLDFTLRIGKKIDTIEAVEMGLYVAEEAGDSRIVTIYRPRVYIVCSEDNPAFFSEDGKLYSRKDGSLVEGFLYLSD